MLFERCHKRSLKHQIKYFDFRCKILLDHPVQILIIQFIQDWYIGDAPGSASFYAYCDDDALCPEDLGPFWLYYAFNTGETLQDPDVTVTCQ